MPSTSAAMKTSHFALYQVTKYWACRSFDVNGSTDNHGKLGQEKEMSRGMQCK
jgi:hypothetical protein